MENIIGVLCILVGIARLAFGFKAQQDVHQSKKDIATGKNILFGQMDILPVV